MKERQGWWGHVCSADRDEMTVFIQQNPAGRVSRIKIGISKVVSSNKHVE